MNSNYLFGIFGAILVVAIGIFLVGRDGTEEPSPITITEQKEVALEPLPQNENTDEEEVLEEEPVLESEDDDEANQENVEDLPETDAEEAAEENTEEEENTVDTTIVTYSDQGFSPKSIAIENGDTVVWMNNSSRNMWVASAVHPTHNEYPEESDEDCGGSTFDACTGIPVGESWEFTFSEVGTWGYHDHLSPSRTGTIEVE